MTLISGLAIYFIIWWLTLFTVLPWKVESAFESDDAVEQGHAPSAPVKPLLVQKFLITTVISAVIFAVGYWLFSSGLVSLDGIPFLPEFGSY